MKNSYLLCVLLLWLASCNKEHNNVLPRESGVYIVNEGNFNFGNAEVSFYHPVKKEVTNGLFKKANNYSLGDVAQSMFVYDTIGFIVVNNSAKIEMVALPSFKKIRTIQIPSSSPRYLLPVNDSLAFVTELYANKVHVVNYRTGNIVKQITVPQYTERLVQVGDYIFAEGKKIFSNPTATGALLRLQISTLSYIDKKEFSRDAAGLVTDAQGQIWLALQRDSLAQLPSSLLCFDANFNLLHQYDFADASLSINGFAHISGNDFLLLCGKAVYRANSIGNYQPQLLFTTTAANAYGLGYDAIRGDIYVSDALDYVQSSKLFRYNINGELLHTFTAGVIAGNFAFTYE